MALAFFQLVRFQTLELSLSLFFSPFIPSIQSTENLVNSTSKYIKNPTTSHDSGFICYHPFPDHSPHNLVYEPQIAVLCGCLYQNSILWLLVFLSVPPLNSSYCFNRVDFITIIYHISKTRRNTWDQEI